jgi:hypothetical protein
MHFGKDPDCMTKFMEAGYDIRAGRGKFKYAMDMAQRLTTAALQVCHIGVFHHD